MTKHSSRGGSPHSSAPSSPTHSSGGGGGGRASGFTVEPTALDSMSNKLNSLGQQLTGHSSAVGGAGPGSGAFGVVGQALSGHLSGALSSAQQHIGNIAKAAHGAGSKTSLTAQDLRANEANNSKLFTSIGNSRAMRAGGGGSGPIRHSGSGGPGRYNPYGGRPARPGGGGTVAPPPHVPAPPPPPPPPPAPPLPVYAGQWRPPPGATSMVPQSTHDHVINGEYNKHGNVVGGHVLGNDVDPNKYPNSDPTKYGYGVAGGPPATTAYPNGVYNIHGPSVNFPAYGPPLQKPGMSTMFPPGVPATHVQDMGNQAWNGGQSSGGFGPNNKWYGSATVPQYPNWKTPNAPYYGGQTIQIQGYYNPFTGQPSTYHPSSHQ